MFKGYVGERYTDICSKDGITYTVKEIREHTIRLQDDKGNFLTVGFTRFINDFYLEDK